MAHAALDAERVLAETATRGAATCSSTRRALPGQLELAAGERLPDSCGLCAAPSSTGANLKSLVRTLRLKKDAAFLRELLLPGGTVSPERIVQHGFSSSAAELFAGSALAQAAQAAEAGRHGWKPDGA